MSVSIICDMMTRKMIRVSDGKLYQQRWAQIWWQLTPPPPTP